MKEYISEFMSSAGTEEATGDEISLRMNQNGMKKKFKVLLFVRKQKKNPGDNIVVEIKSQ